MEASEWLGGLAAALKQLTAQGEPGAVETGIQPILDGLKVGSGVKWPPQHQMWTGLTAFLLNSTLLASTYASKATDSNTGDEVWVEDCVVLGAQVDTFVSLTGSGTLAMKFGGAYDSTYSGPEAHIAAENAAGRPAYRCTWASRHYPPPTSSEVNTWVPSGTVISGKAYNLKDDNGNVTGALFRHTSTAGNGETLGSDVWMLRSGYQPPQGGTPPKTVTIAFDATTDLRSFLLAQIAQTSPALEYYSASSYRVRKCAP